MQKYLSKFSNTLKRSYTMIKSDLTQRFKDQSSSLVTSWQIHGEIMETVTNFIFLGSKITDGDCSHEIKKHLLPRRKTMTNPDSILKSRDIHFLTKLPWITRRSNQSILEEILPKYSLKGLMLKLQQFGHLMQRADSLEKTLMRG